MCWLAYVSNCRFSYALSTSQLKPWIRRAWTSLSLATPMHFKDYLLEYDNTICGQHPIGVFLHVSHPRCNFPGVLCWEGMEVLTAKVSGCFWRNCCHLHYSNCYYYVLMCTHGKLMKWVGSRVIESILILSWWSWWSDTLWVILTRLWL